MNFKANCRESLHIMSNNKKVDIEYGRALGFWGFQALGL
jgi:hypothetical protein